MSQQAKIFVEEMPASEELGPDDFPPEDAGHASPDDLQQFQGLHIVEDFKQYEFATGGSRAIALFIDAVVAGALQGAVRAGLGLVVGHSPAILGLCAGSVSVMYYVFTQFNDGQTMGKKIMKIKTIPSDGGELLSFRQVLGRETIGRLISALPLCLGYVGGFRREDKKTWHDRMFKTQVVKVR